MLNDGAAAIKHRTGKSARLAPTSGGLLSRYLDDMGATRLIDRERESELGRQLTEARTAIATIATNLPPSCKRHVLPDKGRGPDRSKEWPLEDLRRFVERLVAHQRTRRGHPKLDALVRQATLEMRRLDRAREELIVANLRLVVHVAKDYRNRGVSMLDVIQDGNVGLMKAVERFDYRRGVKFSTYAHWWIKQAMQRSLDSRGRAIRLPAHVHHKARRIARSSSELSNLLGRDPSSSELAERLEMRVRDVEALQRALLPPLALEDLVFDDSHELLLPVADPRAESPIERLQTVDMRRRVTRTINAALSPRERQIIRLRYGLGGEQEHTLGQIACTLGLSRERIRQIIVCSFRKIAESPGGRELLALAS